MPRSEINRSGEMEVFADPGPDETHDDYYRRQIRSTRNFLRKHLEGRP